ncbi:MAG: insulinase family protein, partial [Bacteroidales bacterium]|nr:insulinase family protein [Bacteroidales bacterium]
MMFKGTDEIATLDWEKEKILLQEISDLFEKRREIEDPKMKDVLYYKIDSLSYEAAKYVATNEYDKMASSIGAKGTNAGTSYDFTVYINNIPSNELEKWARLESERFADMVLRIFHTELETVYEEFNMYQDSDNSRANKMLMKNLFPNHPYGRDVIGLPEHLKNPSMVNIYEFAETFYVPNNIAIALSGDLDYEKTIMVLDKYFGKLEPADLPDINQPKEEPVTGPVVCEITGPSAANIILAYRFNADNSEDYRYVTLIDMILSNSQAGLIDLNLVQQQKVINAGCSPNFMRDYGIHRFYGIPRQGQTLEEVKNLLLDEIEKIKNGEFEEWMIEAVINDMKLSGIRRNESNFGRTWGYIDAFIKDIPYVDRVKFLDELESISKEELMNFAKTHYNENYVVVYKRTGANDELVKVEKPEITPIPINREKQSEFYKEFIKDQPEPIKPVFVDFEKAIVHNHLDKGIKIEYIENTTNELFTLQYVLEMGKNHDLKLPLAVNYLPFLGTEKYTPAELQQEFFKLGISMGVYAGNDRSYVYITGLQKSLEPGLELLEHLIANVEPDKSTYDEYVKGILKKRKDRKLNKSSILWGGLFNYGMYGDKSPYTHLISEDNMKTQDPAELTGLLKGLYSYKHKVFYYGSMPLTKVMQVIEKHHKVLEELKTYPDPVKFVEKETNENKVYFVDYDMVQVNIIMMSKDEKLNMSLLPEATLF